jgi:outer membrane protein insertion porin family/translocation and assembly module TamA
VLEAKTKAVSSINYDIYPVLLTSNPAVDAPVIGYREFRGRAGLERKFGIVTLLPSYNLQAGVPFAYVGELAPTAKSVYISYVELMAELDLRNDRIHPQEGLFASTAVQFAGLGGSARDVRIQPDIRGYVPVVRDKSGFAARFGLGFLFPFNYDTPQGSNDVSVQDTQISYFRSFFSGGPISNRGYPFRGVGPHGGVAFFNPAYAAATEGLDCGTEQAQATPECSIPLGGRTLWEASLEFRFLIMGPLTGTFFCDGSDVYEETTWPTFGRPHLSCGFGPRFDTPVGPIRLDVGYRVPGAQVLGTEARNEGPTNDLLGLPINISFGIGEAF